MKKLIILVVPLLLFGCSSPKVLSIRDKITESSTPAKTNRVQILSGRFSPPSIQLSKGEFLTVENADQAVWTIAADPHPAHSELGGLFKILHRSEFVQYQFNSKGSYGLHTEENPSVKLNILVK